MSKRALINVATGEFYLNKQNRLIKSFENIKGYDNLFTYDWLGRGSKPHNESPYGFKIHVMDDVADSGYTSILWLDSPAYAVKEDISPIFEKMEKEGYYVMSHTDPLYNSVGREALQKFQVTKEQLQREGLNLPSGSCYGFDLTSYKGNTLFQNMLMHEKEGLFYSVDGCHRHDEAILALNMRIHNFPVFFNDPLFQSDSPECVIKSGDGQPE